MLLQLEEPRGAGWLPQDNSREKMVLVLPGEDVQCWVMRSVCVTAACGCDWGKTTFLCFSRALGMVSWKQPVQGTHCGFPVAGSQHPDCGGKKQNLSEPALVLRKVSAKEVLLAGEIRQNMT